MADGCESPLIVWNGVIVDGHNRYAIFRKHGIPFSIQEKNFSSRGDAMLWMLHNQLGRRNLNSYQRVELVPCLFRASRISFNCCVAAKSRFAVGSSSRKISVSIAHADSMETSCRSPLESS